MFGIGKIAGAVIGKVLDSVGLGQLTPFVQLAFSVATGDVVSAAASALRIAAQVTGSKFLQKLDQVASIGMAFAGGISNASNLLKSGRLTDLMSTLKELPKSFEAIQNGTDVMGGMTDILDAFREVKSFADDFQSVQRQLTDARRQFDLLRA